MIVVLEDKVIVVTGGAGLIGREFTRAICKKGGIVIIADLDKSASSEFILEIKNDLGKDLVDYYQMDITDKISIESFISYANKKYGKIDAVVNNAYPRNKNYGRKFEDVEYSDFCENLNLHLGGYFLVSQVFAVFFKSQGFGNIINISSIYGVIAPRFDIYENTDITMPVEYSAIKSAIIHLTKYMSKYFKGMNIRFNSLSLGGIIDEQPLSFINAYKNYALNKGMLNKEDVIGSLIFLLSDESMYVNGHNLIVDDGWTL